MLTHISYTFCLLLKLLSVQDRLCVLPWLLNNGRKYIHEIWQTVLSYYKNEPESLFKCKSYVFGKNLKIYYKNWQFYLQAILCGLAINKKWALLSGDL